MVDLELCYESVGSVIERLTSRQLSAVELMRNTLARIDEVNPQVNCFCFVYHEEALAKAEAADKLLGEGKGAALTGVPIAFKDLTPTAGKTTTLGSYIFEHWVPKQSSAIVEQFEAAGAIIVGKTTTPEFAYDGFCASPLWGETRNPWNLAHTPGGSSGGSGAAVAAGCVGWAEGCDMGGSVRIPAACCGLVGMKPSLGRIPMDLTESSFDNISHFGPLTRTVDDAALFMRYAQGPNERDIQSVVTREAFQVPLEVDPRQLKLAYSLDLGYMAISDGIQANLQETVDLLRSAGAQVEEVPMQWTLEMEAAALQTWQVFMAAFYTEYLDEWRDKMDPVAVELIEAGNRISAPEYKRLEIVRTRAWQALSTVLQKYDALLCPVMSQPAPPLGKSYVELMGTDAQGKSKAMDATAIGNLVGQCPSMSVPSGFAEGNLPLGVQVIGQRFADHETLRIGAAIERLRNFSAQRPAI